MEKTKLVVYNSGGPEDPVPCTGHLCRLENLEVRTVMLDDIMAAPETPDRWGTLRTRRDCPKSKDGCRRKLSHWEHYLPPKTGYCEGCTRALVVGSRFGDLLSATHRLVVDSDKRVSSSWEPDSWQYVW